MENLSIFIFKCGKFEILIKDKDLSSAISFFRVTFDDKVYSSCYDIVIS